MAENENSQDDPTRIHQQGQIEEDEQRRIEEERRKSRVKNNTETAYRPLTAADIALNNTPEGVRTDTRTIASWEVEQTYMHGERTDAYGIKYQFRQIRDKISRVLKDLPLGKKPPLKEEVDAGLVPHTATPSENLTYELTMASRIEWIEIPDGIRMDPSFSNTYRIEDEVEMRNGQEFDVQIVYNTQTGNRVGYYQQRGGKKDDPLSGREYIGIEKEPPDITPPQNVSPEEARQNRLKLADEFGRSVDELHAWIKLLEKKNEQDVFSGDVQAYSEMFKRWGEVIVRAYYFGILYNLPESEKEFQPMGKKIKTAFRAMREIAEGRAYAVLINETEDGEVVPMEFPIPNINALPINRGLNLLAIRYAADRIEEEHPSGLITTEETESGSRGVFSSVKAEDLKIVNDRENLTAAMTAHILSDVMDIDAFHSVAAKEGGQGLETYLNMVTRLSGVEGLNITTEFINDSGKLTHIKFRRENERRSKVGFGYGHLKDHPRGGAGIDLNMEAVPILATHFLKAVTVQVPVRNTQNNEWSKQSITLDQRADGKTDPETGERITYEREGKKYSTFKKGETVNGERVADELEYEVVGIDNLPWDTFFVEWHDGSKIDINKLEIVATKKDRRIKPAEIFTGVNTFAEKVPHELGRLYAYSTWYEFWMSDNPHELFEKMTEKGEPFLRKMIKGSEVSLKMLQTEFEIDDDAMSELIEYERIVAAATPLAAMYSPEDSKKKGTGIPESEMKELQPQGTDYSVKGTPYETYRHKLTQALFASRFVLTDDSDPNPENRRFKRPKDEKLFNWILLNRRAPSPWEVNQVLSEKYFEDSYLKQYEPIFPYRIETS
jgi:hypothetical protein